MIVPLSEQAMAEAYDQQILELQNEMAEPCRETERGEHLPLLRRENLLEHYYSLSKHD